MYQANLKQFLLKCILLPGIILSGLMQAGCTYKREGASFGESPEFSVAKDVADHQVSLKNVSKAIYILDSAFSSIDRPSVIDSFKYYRFFYELNTEYEKNYKRAFAYTDTIKMILERNDATERLASSYALVYYWRGDLLFTTGSYKEAYEEYYRGREVGEKVLDPCGLSDYNYRLGKVLYMQDRYQQSLRQFLKCNQLQRSCSKEYSFRYRNQEVLSNIGLCYYKLNMYDSSVIYYESALTYIDKELPRESAHQKKLYDAARAVVTGNLASIYDLKDNDTAAERMYLESIYLNLESGREVKDAILTSLKLARHYKKTNEYAKMQYTLADCRNLLNLTPYPEAERDWNYLMAQYHEDLDPSTAYRYLTSYDHIRDSLAVAEKQLKSSDLREHLINIEQEQQIAGLEKNNEEKRFFLVIAVAIASLSVVVIIFIVYYMRKLRGFLREHSALNKKITEQKEQLLKALYKVEIANKEKDKILSIVAHDLRSPINSIYALADIMLLEDDLKPDQRESLELIKSASQTSLSLSKEILESAILMQSSELNLEEANVNDLVASTIGLLRFRAADKHQKLDMELPKTPVFVSIDKDKMQRVINNLITNAIKFSKEYTTIEIKVMKDVDGVLISVKDQGIGIPVKIQNKIFEMFTEAKREGTGGEKPFGLGLSISKQIIEAHGGRIWLESEEGVGTTFYTTIPFDNPPGTGRARKNAEAYS